MLLVDCQGTGDVRQSSLSLDTLITYISLQISSVQIINLKGQMTSDDLNRLKVSFRFQTPNLTDKLNLVLSIVLRIYRHFFGFFLVKIGHSKSI